MRKLLVLSTVVLFLGSCGYTCVGPVGDQSKCYQATNNSGSTTSGVLTFGITPSGKTSSNIIVNEQITLTATGGVPPYKWRLESGDGTLQVGTGGTTEDIYFLGNTVIFSSAIAGSNTVMLQDGNKQPIPIALLVKASR